MNDYFVYSCLSLILSIFVYFQYKTIKYIHKSKYEIIWNTKRENFELMKAVLADDEHKKNMIKELDAGVQLLLDIEKERTSKEINDITGN